MQTADVVLYDRLVSPQILDLVSTDSTMLYVGKQSGYHTRTQDEIEAMMLAFAANGATIVRLKGGDPLVFGRGGEEMEALAARGHEVRIVPGITAAAGVGSELGIPLTHRGVATSVRLLTGHLREGAAKEAASGDGNAVADAVDFAVTSADLDTTLVVVSHNMHIIAGFVDSVALLTHGKLTLFEDAFEGIRQYSGIFRNGGEEEYFIGSADCMKRNLESRVEVLAPVEPPELRSELRTVLDLLLADTSGAWEMEEDGSYRHLSPAGDEERLSAQHELVERAIKKHRQATRLKRRGLRSTPRRTSD